MTCVVGIEVGDGRVVLGADSASAAGSTVLRARTPKVFIAHGIGYANCGSWRLINVLQHTFAPPPRPENSDDERYLVANWCQALRSHLGGEGVLSKKNDVQGTDGGALLIAFRGGLFEFHSDFQITRGLAGYAANGSGRDYALGSLVTTAALGLSAERRVELALAAAAEHNWAVREPFNVVTVDA